MNRKDIMQMLLQLLSDIDIHPRMVEELIGLIVGSGYEAKFFTMLSARLKVLLECGIEAVQKKEYEVIGNDIYSMHLAGRGFNIRILFSFLPNGAPTLLLCFYERAGKKKTDYSSYLAPAAERLEQRKEVYRFGTQ